MIPGLRRDRRPRVLAFVDLVQDIDVLAPLLLAPSRSDLRWRVLASRWLKRESPRTEAVLREAGIPFRYAPRAGVTAGTTPDLRGIAAVVTAAESSNPAHTAAHALAHRANGLGIATYTLQHGLENPGLRGREAAERFASRTVFCWSESAADGLAASPDLAGKLAPVGRPWLSAPTAAPRYDLAVFENLHADAYSDADRGRFERGLALALAAGSSVLLRPHPAGRWGLSLFERLKGQGDLVLHPLDSLGGSREAVGLGRRIVTSPSTIALDAAMMDRAPALALPGGRAYDGLPVLDPADWPEFARGALPDATSPGAFVARHVMPGDAVGRILARITSDVAGSGLSRGNVVKGV